MSSGYSSVIVAIIAYWLQRRSVTSSSTGCFDSSLLREQFRLSPAAESILEAVLPRELSEIERRASEDIRRAATRPAARRYIPALDGLRGVAVACVVVYHFELFAGIESGGILGVDIFFVLSGYLITQVLLDSQSLKRPFFSFYWNRFTRLFPPLFAVSLALYFLPRSLLPKWGAVLESAGALLYVSNWTRAFPVLGWSNIMAHTWSLSVEEQFYLIWPATMLLAGSRKKATRWMVVTATISALGWFFAMNWIGATDNHIYNGFDTRCGAILLGACLAVFPEVRCSPLVAFAASIIYFGLVATQTWNYLSAPATWAIAMIIIVYARDPSAPGIVGRALRTRPLVGLGLISYSVYLWHWPIFVVMHRLNIPPILGGVAGIALTVLISITSYFYLERPAKWFREFVRPERRNDLGKLILAVNLLSVAAGIMFFYGGFIKTAPW